MEELYFKLVVAGRRTCGSNANVKAVPHVLRQKVLMLLTERGYDENGNKI